MELPVVFLGHGSPMNAVEETVYADSWRRLGRGLRQRYGSAIRAVLAVSAHWCTGKTAVTAMPHPQTIHDFGGFPQKLFDVRYPAPGSPDLAAEIVALLGEDRAAADMDWGLDHGAWGVLVHLFPEADIPVVQLGLNVNLDAAGHFALGRQLAALRKQGVLIVASGNIVHNLRLLDRSRLDSAGEGFAWAEEIRSRVNRLLEARDFAALAEVENLPAMQSAAPTPEHWWPLLYAAGAAHAGDAVRIFNDDIVGGSLSMTSVVFGADGLLPQ